MASKKRGQADSDELLPNTSAVIEPAPPAALAPIQCPAWIDGPPVPLIGEKSTPAELQKRWNNPYVVLFANKAKGFEMGENRQSKQLVFKFRERPEQSVIDTLRANGFTYWPAEKSWTIQSTPDTRRLSGQLAQQFAQETPGWRR